jgi:signal transduction histidine kinase
VPWPRRLTIAIAALSGVGIAAGAFGLPGVTAEEASWFAACVGFGVLSIVLSLVISARLPNNRVAPMLAVNGLGGVLVAPPTPVTSDVTVALSQGSWMWLYVPLALLVVLYPDGRLPGPRWRVVAYGLPLVAVLFTIGAAMDPNPFPEPYEHAGRPFGVLPGAVYAGLFALLPIFLGLLIACAVAVVRRYRVADETDRIRLRWLALAGLSVPLTLLLCWLSYLLLDTADLVLLGLAIMYLSIPVAATIGLLAPQRFDVDRAISATIAYGLVTTAVLAAFTAVSAAGGVVLGRDSAVLAAATAAAVAVGLAPVRRMVQQRVDRRLSPRRRAALTAMEELRGRIHSGASAPEELPAVLRTALRDPLLQVGLRLPGAPGFVDIDGAPVPVTGTTYPVMLGTDEVGVLVPGSPAAASVMQKVAAAAAPHVEVIRLRQGLTQALREVEASRARILQATDVERRRLERDLHDGAQQRLVSLAMAIRIAQRHLDDPTFDLNGVLEQTVAGLATAVAELRALAHGVRPSSLDDGLRAALDSLTRDTPVDVDLSVTVGDLPEEVSTTAYYVANEALANAVKYSGARRIGLEVREDNGHVRVQVRDDGVGGATPRPGSGLAGIADRVSAVGGRLSVRSPERGGTVVEARLPCGS